MVGQKKISVERMFFPSAVERKGKMSRPLRLVVGEGRWGISKNPTFPSDICVRTSLARSTKGMDKNRNVFRTIP